MEIVQLRSSTNVDALFGCFLVFCYLILLGLVRLKFLCLSANVSEEARIYCIKFWN